LFPAGSPNTAQDALMLGPRGYNVSHLRGRGPVCAPVLPGTVRPDWPVRAPCSCEAEIAGGTPLTPYGTARVLACPLASPRAAWAWYSASGRPTLFMVTSLPGDEGAGLFAALDYRDWLPGHHVARSVFAKPQHCPMPPAPPGKAAPAAAPSHSPPCHLGAPETQRWTASIAGDPIDHVLQRQAGFHALDLPQHADRESLRHRLCRVVRRNRHLRMIPERARLRQRLARKDVKRRARQRALVERGEDVGIDLQRAPPGVDQEGPAQRAARIELADQIEIDDPARGWRGRQETGENLGPTQERLEPGAAVKGRDAGERLAGAAPAPDPEAEVLQQAGGAYAEH